MMYCKKHFIAAVLFLIMPLAVWSEAPVVDESDNFAQMDEQQGRPSVASPKYDEAPGDYSVTQADTGEALVKEEKSNDSRSPSGDNATLIDKVQSLQQEVQELRGQLEVQAHDLSVLKQQQLAFYKDLDARLGKSSSTAAKPMLDIGSDAKAPSATAPAARGKKTAQSSAEIVAPVAPVSRINPADEQISYLAAYELVKAKRYEPALMAMHTFVQKYPNGGYTANAQYWLGELYLVKKDYPKALEHFDVVLQRYPSSTKSAASMLKTGYIYAATGNQEQANKQFKQVVQNYPNTAAAKRAHARLEGISAL
jgi:tol-pal system protein YbgF